MDSVQFAFEEIAGNRIARWRKPRECVQVWMFPRIRQWGAIYGTWTLMHIALLAATVYGLVMDWTMSMIAAAAAVIACGWFVGFLALVFDFRSKKLLEWRAEFVLKNPDVEGVLCTFRSPGLGIMLSDCLCFVEIEGPELRVHAGKYRAVFHPADLVDVRRRAAKFRVPGDRKPRTARLRSLDWPSGGIRAGNASWRELRQRIDQWRYLSSDEPSVYPPQRLAARPLNTYVWFRLIPFLVAILAASAMIVGVVRNAVSGGALGGSPSDCLWLGAFCVAAYGVSLLGAFCVAAYGVSLLGAFAVSRWRIGR